MVSRAAKHCDECQHFVLGVEGRAWKEICALEHRPRFYIPQTLSQAHSSDWGWKRRCEDFKAVSKETP